MLELRILEEGNDMEGIGGARRLHRETGSGLSTTGLGSRVSQGPLLTPGFSAFTTIAVTTGSATKETRPYPESDLHLMWAHFSSSCKQGIFFK